jgi:hypothetical protein
MPARRTTHAEEHRLVDGDTDCGLRRRRPIGRQPPCIRQIPLRLTDGYPVPAAKDFHTPSIRAAFRDKRAYVSKASPPIPRVGSSMIHALVS